MGIPYSELPADAPTGTKVQIGNRKFIRTPFRWIAMSGTNEAEIDSKREKDSEDSDTVK